MTKPIAILFIGDTHAGSPFALAKPGWVYPSQGNKSTALNRSQRWLWSCWKKTVERATELSKSHSIVLLYGGDSTEGWHHDSVDADGTPLEQLDMAVELLRPLARLATAVRVCLGTSAHVGVNGERDRKLAQELCGFTPRRVIAQHWHRLNIGGRIIHWSHKYITVSDNPATESSGMISRARKDYWRCLSRGAPPPNLIVGHHAHRSPDSIREKGAQVAICPAWQLPTNHGGEEYAGTTTDIGYLIYDCERNDLEQVIFPQEVNTEKVRSGY